MTHLPKKTFHNLPEEKRLRIIAVALAEFAEKGYAKASVNTIVKEVGIAKGSLYQYFESKETLFFYLFDEFTVLVKRAVKEAAQTGGEGFFEQVRAVFLAGVRFIRQHPAYYRLYLHVLFEQELPGREKLIAKVRLFSAEYFGPLCDQCKAAGDIRTEVPTDLAIFLIDAILDRFLQGFAARYLDGGLGLSELDDHTLILTIDRCIEVLRNGLGVCRCCPETCAID